MANWLRFLLGHLVLPFSRAELPGWGRLASPLGAFGFPFDHLWSGLPKPIVRGKWHGYLMRVDLSDWSQRPTWFTGRYYELDTQLVIKEFVQLGDTFIDVGANIGMITLLASHQVGSGGLVISFEPNPNACGALEEIIRMNRIENANVFKCALSDRRGEAELAVVGRYNLLGTLGEATGLDTSEITEVHTVNTIPGDEILSKSLNGKIFIKVDVEGFEPFVVSGLRKTIKYYTPMILTEFYPDHFKRANTSGLEFIKLMSQLGYIPFEIEVYRHWLRHEFRLLHADVDAIEGPNIFWIHQDVVATPEVRRHMVEADG